MPRTHRLIPLAAVILGTTLLGACHASRDATGPAALRVAREADAAASAQLILNDGETGYFDGQVYAWQFPSGSSSNQNQLVVDCFHLGVDFTSHQSSPAGRLYAVFLPGAHQHSCPDGSVQHDHILSAVPGAPGYSTLWDLWEAWPGPNFDPAIMPITSEAALLAAAAAQQVVLLDDQLPLHAVVIGPVRP